MQAQTIQRRRQHNREAEGAHQTSIRPLISRIPKCATFAGCQQFYNDQRPHQALGYRTPAEVFHQARNAPGKESKMTEDPPERVLVSSAGATGLSLNSTSILSN